MNKPPPARYRTTNWSSYNASLRKRGSLLIWVDKDMAWRAPRDGRPGRPPVFSDAAIQVSTPSELTHADGHGERKAALEMINRHSPGSTRHLTLGADKGYDSADFVAELRQMAVTPHVAQKARHSAIDGRTTQHPGYALSQRCRKKIEEPFGWAKTVGGMAQTLYRSLDRVRAQFTMTMAACNLARLPKLLAA